MRCCVNCDAPLRGSLDCSNCGHNPQQIDGFVAYAPELARSAPGYDPSYFSQLAALESHNFWFIARNELIRDRFSKFLAQAESYLEVGCGTGFVLKGIAEAFPQLRLVGSEIYVQGLPFAAQRVPRAELLQMDAAAIPFREEFDVIGAFDVLEHIEADEAVLRQLHKALRPNGSLILTVPQHPSLWSRQDEIAHHARRYTWKELRGKLLSAGFDITWSSSFVSLLLPALVVSRSKKRSFDAEFDAFSEFKISPRLNTLLLLAMRLERSLIGLGAHFPIGGSRMVVARKSSQ